MVSRGLGNARAHEVSQAANRVVGAVGSGRGSAHVAVRAELVADRLGVLFDAQCLRECCITRGTLGVLVRKRTAGQSGVAASAWLAFHFGIYSNAARKLAAVGAHVADSALAGGGTVCGNRCRALGALAVQSSVDADRHDARGGRAGIAGVA